MTEFIQILIGGLVVGCIYATIALGFSLVYRVTGVINLAQGGFCILGALSGYTCAGWLGLSEIPAALLGVALSTLFGAVVGTLSFVPGLTRLSNANMLMLTAGILTFIEGLSLLLWGSQPYSLLPFSRERPFDVFGILVPSQSFWVVAAAAAIFLGLWYLLSRTKQGRALRACAENVAAAPLMGISVSRMTLLSFSLAAAMGAVAGVVLAPTTSLQFDTGRLFTISGFIAVAIGGLGSFPGAVAGGLLLGVVTQLATAYISSLFSNAIALLVLLIVLIWKPSGLLSGGIGRRQDVRQEARVWKHITRLKPATILIGSFVALVTALLLPFIVSEGILSGIVIAGILFIALIGLDVIMGYAGQVSLGQSGFMAIGGYAAGFLSIQYEMPPIIGVIAGVVLALICSLVLSSVTLRLQGLYLALATLSFGLLIDSLAVGLTDITGGPSGMVGIPSFSIGSFEFDSPVSMYYLVLGFDLVLLVLISGVISSSFGRALQAIRTDQLAAAALGVNVIGCKIVAFALSAVLAAISGSLLAFFFHFLSPEMVGTSRSLELVAMLVIGGEGTLLGPLFGSVLLTMLPTVFQPLALYKTLVTGALLVVCFLYMPEGIFGVIARWLDNLSSRSKVLQAFAADNSKKTNLTSATSIAAPPTDPTVSALRVVGLNRYFGGIKATSDVSFEVPQGTLTALIGPNGAGKTTIFNLITNLLSPDSGEIYLYGKRINGISPTRIAELGLIRTFQSARVFPGMTVRENVLVGRHLLVETRWPSHMFWLPSARHSERELAHRAEALLDVVCLSRFSDAHATELPMGAQKLLEVVRALMARPRLLLLDEPAAGLNDTETAELAALLRAIRASGITVLIVEHNMSLVMNVADQVVVLETGSVIASGTAAQVQRNPAVITAYLGSESAA
jgi:branched-chain amino acid transport system permease protein